MKKYWLWGSVVFLLGSCIKSKEKEAAQSVDNQLVITKGIQKKDTLEIKCEDPKISVIEQKMVKAGLVPIQSIDSTVMVELKYSTTDNFVGADIYGDFSTGYLQKEAAIKLAKANELIKKVNSDYRLLIYDAARPRSVQYILWDILKVPVSEKRKYVTDPKEGSIHNYGCAVDLTIFDKKNNKPLDMGTKFDFFGKLAFPTQEEYFLRRGELSKLQVENRRLLRRTMQRAGYQEIETEWWHFVAFSKVDTQQKFKIIE